MKKMNKRTSVFFPIGCVLLFLVLLSAHMTDGVFGRYGSGFSGNSSARVAKFEVESGFSDAQSYDISLNFYDPNALSDSVSISVVSKSEVTVSYDVIVTMPVASADYAWLAVTLDGASPTSYDDESGVFVFSNVATIAFDHDAPNQNTIRFEIRTEYHGNPPSGLTDISGQMLITVRAEQVD